MFKTPRNFILIASLFLLVFILLLIFLGELYLAKKEKKQALPKEETTPTKEIEKKLRELPPLPNEISPEKIEEDLRKLNNIKLPQSKDNQENKLSPEEIEKQLKNL
jgi:regulatory protein YycI of two-component signal transduction system YycFG